MNFYKVIGFWILLTTAASGQVAPDHPTPPGKPADTPWPYLETLAIFKEAHPAAPLTALLHLRENRQRALDDPAFSAMYFDILATVCSFAGDHTAALEAEKEYFARAEPRVKTSANLTGYHAIPAATAILDACKDRRVIMLNEEHRLSLQRSFLADLLPELHKQGFTHLAMEALGEDAAALQTRGYAVMQTGLYTKDPQFAEAIRLAISLGMHVVKYEPDPKDVGPESGDRDRRSALALADLLKKEPTSRIVVYAGRYHIAKRGDQTWTPLAARLREFTGIDPLCVDLIAMRECHRPEDEYADYRAALNAGLVTDTPIALMNAEGHLFSHWPEQIDFPIFFPRTMERDGRPDWLARGQRHSVSIADHFPTTTQALLIRADRPGELADAIAADQVIVQPGSPAPNLMLPPGRFNVRILTTDSQALAEFEVNVGP